MNLIYYSVRSFRSRLRNGVKGFMGSIVILACCEHHFIRVHKILVQHPSNNKSIVILSVDHFNFKRHFKTRRTTIFILSSKEQKIVDEQTDKVTHSASARCRDGDSPIPCQNFGPSGLTKLELIMFHFTIRGKLSKIRCNLKTKIVFFIQET